MTNLQEAFRKLNMLESNDYELLNQDEKDAMKNFLEDDEIEAEETDIIDPQAEDESELEDSYVGKIIVQCPVCKSLIYKTQEELDEEGDDPQSCPYCFSVENFDLIGKIVPIEDEAAPEVAPEEVEAAEEPVVVEESKEKCPECGKEICECGDAPLKEDLENVTIETENEIINVSSEEKSADIDVAPVEEVAPIEDAEADEHEAAEVIAPLDDEESVEVDEVDEDSFDEFAESWLREDYKNIKSYKSNRFIEQKNRIKVEGVVTLANGKKKLTEFVIRPARHISRNMKTSCLVENVNLKTRKMVGARIK